MPVRSLDVANSRVLVLASFMDLREVLPGAAFLVKILVDAVYHSKESWQRSGSVAFFVSGLDGDSNCWVAGL